MTDNLGLAPGSIINQRYKICNTLGRGGVGVVVKAEDLNNNGNFVALKFLFPSLLSQPSIFARFQNECSLVQSLKHQNIVQVYGFDKAAEDLYYIAMEYIDGCTLFERIYQGTRKLSFLEVLVIVDQIAQSLSFAHNRGVIHRDLKPENILLDRLGQIKLSDFGFASSLDSYDRFTQAGVRVGTPLYMSPEQLTDAPPDPRTDIYAMGIVGYELCLGHHPFGDHKTIGLDAIKKISQLTLPKLSSAETGIPMWFEKVLRKCTAKDPNDRYPSMTAFLNEFRSYMQRIQRVDLPPVAETFREFKPSDQRKENGQYSIAKNKFAHLKATLIQFMRWDS